jgi:hypothetical protein
LKLDLPLQTKHTGYPAGSDGVFNILGGLAEVEIVRVFVDHIERDVNLLESV